MPQEIEKNLPTCIEVDWEKAWQEHCEMLQNPEAVVFPRIYQLETTSRCNLKCVMCPRKTMTRPSEDMPEGLFRQIVNEYIRPYAGNGYALELFGFGEPFCDPLLTQRIKCLQQAGVYVVIATNGLLIDRQPEAALLADYLVFDVDALSEEQYLGIRQGGNYQTMQKNLEWLLRNRKKYTVLQFIALNSDGKDFLEAFKGKADETRIKFFDSFAGQVKETPSQTRVCCLEQFYGVAIWANGDVVTCDRDINGKQRIGNLHQIPLDKIWDSFIAQKHRFFHSRHTGEKLPLCAKCPEWKLTNFRNVPNLTVNMFKGGFV